MAALSMAALSMALVPCVDERRLDTLLQLSLRAGRHPAVPLRLSELREALCRLVGVRVRVRVGLGLGLGLGLGTGLGVGLG